MYFLPPPFGLISGVPEKKFWSAISQHGNTTSQKDQAVHEAFKRQENMQALKTSVEAGTLTQWLHLAFWIDGYFFCLSMLAAAISSFKNFSHLAELRCFYFLEIPLFTLVPQVSTPFLSVISPLRGALVPDGSCDKWSWFIMRLWTEIPPFPFN